MKELKDYITNIPDFPQKGIIFRDVTSVLQDADGLKLAIDSMQKNLEGLDFDVIVGAESRGFVFGMPLAYNMHKPFVMIRKKGKLPRETIEQSYDLEYGTATLEMHKDAIKRGQKIVIVDDLIATGGTAEAMIKLVNWIKRFEWKRKIEKLWCKISCCLFGKIEIQEGMKSNKQKTNKQKGNKES